MFQKLSEYKRSRSKALFQVEADRALHKRPGLVLITV